MHLFCMFYVDRRTTVCPGDGFRNSEGRGGGGGGEGQAGLRVCCPRKCLKMSFLQLLEIHTITTSSVRSRQFDGELTTSGTVTDI